MPLVSVNSKVFFISELLFIFVLNINKFQNMYII